MRRESNDEDRKVLFNSFRAGVIALVFLLLGFQLALFVYKAAELRILANRDHPDTVYIYSNAPAHSSAGNSGTNRQISNDDDRTSATYAQSKGYSRGTEEYYRRSDTEHDPRVEAIRKSKPRRDVESFRFNPNTVSIDDLQRLGFSPKQAESIDNYRLKGGRFYRKSDFAKSYVVSDSVYRRLEPYIDIPLLDINKADSAAFDSLPGIGGYFASRMAEYRSRLGGYSCKEQLMEIYNFDQERFDKISDLICVGEARPFRLWSLPPDSLRLHPHIRSWSTAKAIVLFRENNDPSSYTIDELESAGILTAEQAKGLRLCRIAE